ncbi:MAG: hypothetical protein B0D92_00695 [Spirochaeta sp. LUC14_002_19_P3]|nr:MAG: hypothetical protein B0D92_00695 [Spirochaeta sp. LUC14_002_19_P3]
MNSRFLLIIIIILIWVVIPIYPLPVPLGTIEIGLESFDGYQEGMAWLNTNETGDSLEILIAYKGFGLDTVSWIFSSEGLTAFRDASAKASWWRSRLLEMNVEQTVLKDIAAVKPNIIYTHKEVPYPFNDTENILRFVRQGGDYALLLTEPSMGAETRRSGKKTLPVFTLHIAKKELPLLRGLLSQENMTQVLQAYGEQKSMIETILAGSP